MNLRATILRPLRPIVLCCVLSLFAYLPGSAQTANAVTSEKNEVGLIIGVTATPNRTLSPGSVIGDTELTSKASLALGLDYDRRIVSTDWITLYGGANFLASPFDVKLSNPPASVSPQYAYYFMTGHLKAKFYANSKLSPWLSAGVGYARFNEKPPSAALTFNQGTGRSTIELGAGFDTQPVGHVASLPVAFRVEIRDFYSGLPDYGLTLVHSKQHNVVLGGGLVLRF